MNDRLKELEDSVTKLSTEVVDLCQQLASAEAKAEHAYDSGFQHGFTAAKLESAAQAA